MTKKKDGKLEHVSKTTDKIVNRLKRGTPTTLDQAIENALDELFEESGIDYQTSNIQILKSHIIDFLAQRFGAFIMKSDYSHEAVCNLWELISGRKVGGNYEP